MIGEINVIALSNYLVSYRVSLLYQNLYFILFFRSSSENFGHKP